MYCGREGERERERERESERMMGLKLASHTFIEGRRVLAQAAVPTLTHRCQPHLHPTCLASYVRTRFSVPIFLAAFQSYKIKSGMGSLPTPWLWSVELVLSNSISLIPAGRQRV